MKKNSEIVIRELCCLRCEKHWWPQRPEPPVMCPACKSRLWNVEKDKPVRNKGVLT